MATVDPYSPFKFKLFLCMYACMYVCTYVRIDGCMHADSSIIYMLEIPQNKLFACFIRIVKELKVANAVLNLCTRIVESNGKYV